MSKLFLASQSPRRREILQKAGYQFDTLTLKVSEIIKENLSPEQVVLDISEQKMRACIEQHPEQTKMDAVILTSDTLVCIDNQVLGKPETAEIAWKYLKQLSGRVHEVKTAYSILKCPEMRHWTKVSTTKVKFRNLSEQEIADYIASGDPFDKAGAYGVQNKDFNLVESMDGDFFNVMGLPMMDIENTWKELKIYVDKK